MAAPKIPDDVPALRHFAYLKKDAAVASHYALLADILVETLLPEEELSLAIRKLLESRDEALRARRIR